VGPAPRSVSFTYGRRIGSTSTGTACGPVRWLRDAANGWVPCLHLRSRRASTFPPRTSAAKGQAAAGKALPRRSRSQGLSSPADGSARTPRHAAYGEVVRPCGRAAAPTCRPGCRTRVRPIPPRRPAAESQNSATPLEDMKVIPGAARHATPGGRPARWATTRPSPFLSDRHRLLFRTQAAVSPVTNPPIDPSAMSIVMTYQAISAPETALRRRPSTRVRSWLQTSDPARLDSRQLRQVHSSIFPPRRATST